MVKILCGDPKIATTPQCPEPSESGLPDSEVTASEPSGLPRAKPEQACLKLSHAIFFAWHIPPTFTIHQDLLCRYSRFFRQRMHQDLGSEIVADCLMRIECSDARAAIAGRESDYVSCKDAPSGYLPSWVGLAEDYRRRARESSPLDALDQAVTGDSQAEEIVSLENESKDLFAIFVHWVYTQTLVLDDVSAAEDQEILCARLYGLAERLDVPALRQQCYSRLYKYYGENNTMPELEVLEVIIKECSLTSLLRKYMVAVIAHEIITHGHDSKEYCDPILALDKTFAAEVALDIMDRLRSDEDSADPNSGDRYEVDDSDSDVGSSVDIGPDIDYDTDGYMSILDGEEEEEEEEEESVIGDTPEGKQAVVEAPQSASKLSLVNPDRDAGVPVPGSSTATEGLPQVKIEGGNSAGGALLDVNSNKRKRASQSFGKDENSRTKRPETQTTDDVDFVDLTEWANSD